MGTMIGQTHATKVLVPDALSVWTTKLGSTRPLVLGTYVSGTLTAIDAPVLHVRRPEQDAADAQSFALAELADTEYNLQRNWTAQELAALGSGHFIAEVRGTIGGNAVVFPDSGYIELRVLPGVG